MTSLLLLLLLLLILYTKLAQNRTNVTYSFNIEVSGQVAVCGVRYLRHALECGEACRLLTIEAAKTGVLERYTMD